jgi:HEAT repeat protein
MRRQDEVLALLDRQPAAGQAWLAREMEVLPAYFDSADLVSGAAARLTGTDGDVALLAALERIRRRHLSRRLAVAAGLDPGEAGEWTCLVAGSIVGPGSGSGDPGTRAMPEEGAERITGAALAHSAAHIFAPVIEILLDRQRRRPRELSLMVLPIGRFRIPATLDLLRDALGRANALPGASLALGGFGAEGATELLSAAERGASWVVCPALYGLREASMAGAAETLTAGEAIARLSRVADRLPAGQRGALAVALEGMSPSQVASPLERILASGDQWDVAQVLETLRRSGSREAMDLIEPLLARKLSVFVRCALLRAMGGLATDRCRELVAAALDSPVEIVRAAALEAGARAGLGGDVLDSAMAASLRSGTARSRAAGLRVAAVIDPRRGLRETAELLISDDAALRLVACHLIGYFPGPRVHGLLAAVATRDPDPAVRLHALYSLQRMIAAVPVGTNIETMEAILADTAPQVRRKAAFLLADLGAAHPDVVGPAVTRLALAARNLDDQVALAECLGRMASTSDLIRLKEIGPGQDPRIRAGFVRGLEDSPADEALPRLRELLRDPSPVVAARAAVGMFRHGDMQSTEVLAGIAASDAHWILAAEALDEIGHLVQSACAAPPLAPSVVSSLKAHLRTVGYGRFHQVARPVHAIARPIPRPVIDLAPLGASTETLDEAQSGQIQLHLDRLYVRRARTERPVGATISRSAHRLTLLAPPETALTRAWLGALCGLLLVGALLFRFLPWLSRSTPEPTTDGPPVWTGVRPDPANAPAPSAPASHRILDLSSSHRAPDACAPRDARRSLTLGFSGNSLELRPGACASVLSVVPPEKGSRRFAVELLLASGGAVLEALIGEPQIKIKVGRLTLGSGPALFLVATGASGDRLGVVAGAVSAATHQGRLLRVKAGESLSIAPDGTVSGPRRADLVRWAW